MKYEIIGGSQRPLGVITKSQIKEEETAPCKNFLLFLKTFYCSFILIQRCLVEPSKFFLLVPKASITQIFYVCFFTSILSFHMGVCVCFLAKWSVIFHHGMMFIDNIFGSHSVGRKQIYGNAISCYFSLFMFMNNSFFFFGKNYGLSNKT